MYQPNDRGYRCKSATNNAMSKAQQWAAMWATCWNVHTGIAGMQSRPDPVCSPPVHRQSSSQGETHLLCVLRNQLHLHPSIGVQSPRLALIAKHPLNHPSRQNGGDLRRTLAEDARGVGPAPGHACACLPAHRGHHPGQEVTPHHHCNHAFEVVLPPPRLSRHCDRVSPPNCRPTSSAYKSPSRRQEPPPSRWR